MSLQHFLFKIKAVDLDWFHWYSYREGSQTLKHILLQCLLYAEACREMIAKLYNIEGLWGKLSDYNILMSDL
jgi:hypothetical protein